MNGLIGIKDNQTKVFNINGKAIPVTIIKVTPNTVTQVKTKDSKDNYDALQLSISPVKKQRAIKPQIGHFKKANSDVFKYTKEIKGMTGHNLGSKISCSDIFKVGEFVDVTGITKGKGFAGVIKRYGHKIGPKGHGSGYHRGVGSMGPITQNRIFKHKKMPGRMGTNLVTIQNLEIISIDVDSNYVLVKGAIPGAKKGLVVIYQAIKKQKANKPTELFNYGLNKETKEDIKLKAQKQHDVDEKNKADLNKEVIAKETAAGEVAKKRHTDSNDELENKDNDNKK